MWLFGYIKLLFCMKAIFLTLNCDKYTKIKKNI